MSKTKRNIIISLVINLIIIILVLLVFIINMANGRKLDNFFMYYTNSSNVLSAFSCLILGAFEIRFLCLGKEIPKIVYVIKYIGVVTITLTFLIVATILAPSAGIKKMYTGNGFFTHLICPILMVVSFMIFERIDGKMKLFITFIGWFPTCIYGVLYYINTVVISQKDGGWPDIYRFVTGPIPIYVIFPSILSIAYGICFIVFVLKNSTVKKSV